jgi:hypothetical protein
MHTSQLLAALTLSAAFIGCTASASPVHPVQYEVRNDQQTVPRDLHPACDQQTVANQQTPSELQSSGAQRQSSQDQPRVNGQPASSEQKGEQASAPPPRHGQPNAFVSGSSNEPQDVAQTEARSKQSSDPYNPQSQQAPPSETKSGEEHDP